MQNARSLGLRVSQSRIRDPGSMARGLGFGGLGCWVWGEGC